MKYNIGDNYTCFICKKSQPLTSDGFQHTCEPPYFGWSNFTMELLNSKSTPTEKTKELARKLLYGQ